MLTDFETQICKVTTKLLTLKGPFHQEIDKFPRGISYENICRDSKKEVKRREITLHYSAVKKFNFLMKQSIAYESQDGGLLASVCLN